MKVDSDALINILKEVDALSIREITAIPLDGGLDFHAMDPSCTSIVKAVAKPAAFPDGCDMESATSLSIPFLLGALQKGKMCDMEVKGGQIVVKYDKSKRTHRLIDPEEKARPVPSLEGWDTCVVMSDDILTTLKQSCFTDIKSDNGGVMATMFDAGLRFSIRSDTESAEMVVDGTAVLEEGEQTAVFSTAVLLPIVKSLPRDVMITISMKTNAPMVLSIDEDTYSMKIFIAPLIIED